MSTGRDKSGSDLATVASAPAARRNSTRSSEESRGPAVDSAGTCGSDSAPSASSRCTASSSARCTSSAGAPARAARCRRLTASRCRSRSRPRLPDCAGAASGDCAMLDVAAPAAARIKEALNATSHDLKRAHAPLGHFSNDMRRPTRQCSMLSQRGDGKKTGPPPCGRRPHSDKPRGPSLETLLFRDFDFQPHPGMYAALESGRSRMLERLLAVLPPGRDEVIWIENLYIRGQEPGCW